MIDGRIVVAAGALLVTCLSAPAHAQDEVLKIRADARTANMQTPAEQVAKLAGLRNYTLVCLDMMVAVDGRNPGAVLTANEGDTRRYPVDCRAGQYGSFKMVGGVEYYLPNIGKVDGKEVDLEIYPGTRTDHPFNDVDCSAHPDQPNSAVFHISGFYTVKQHDFDRTVVELRPAPLGEGVTRAAAAACLQ